MDIVNRSIIYCIVPILITPLIFSEYPCLSHPQNLQTTFSYPFVMDYEMQRLVVFGKSGCMPVKELLLGKTGCIRARVVVFGQSGCIQVKRVVFGQRVFVRAKVVVFGKKWLY